MAYPNGVETWLQAKKHFAQDLITPPPAVSYLEGGEVHCLEMLQGLTEGDELPRLVHAGPAPCGKREDTPGLVTGATLSANMYQGPSGCHL